MTHPALDAFVNRCDDYCARRSPALSRARLSTLLFNDGKRLDAIVGGSDVGHRRLAQASVDLAALEAALEGPERAAA